jgi:hypothetical protein
MGLYRQMIGRAIRSAPGKTEAIILDHAGATLRHGFAEDRVEWTLDPDEGAVNATHREYEKSGKDRFLDCSQCGGLREGGKACPCCGFLPAPKPVEFQMREGELGLLQRDGMVKKPEYDAETKQQWFAMLRYIAAERGRSQGWVGNSYRDKFGDWPPRYHLPAPIPPTPEVRAWARHRDIKFARAMAAKSRGEAA